MAAGGDWQWPLVGMLAFSTVFALPFFVLALMPQLMASLPKSGGWMNSVKVLMAFLEVAAAMKFLANVDLVWGWGIFTHDVVLASWVVHLRADGHLRAGPVPLRARRAGAARRHRAPGDVARLRDDRPVADDRPLTASRSANSRPSCRRRPSR